MPTIATDQIADEAIAGSAVFAPPTVVVTAPIGSISTSSTTVTWTYASTASRPQVTYRVRLLTVSGGSELFDSGIVAGAGTSYAPAFTLSGGSSYIAEVTVSDGFAESTDTDTFYVDAADVSDFPDEPRVGSVFECAINGVGYMLADTPERPYRRQVGTLNPPRFATGDTPFSEAIERYTMVGQSDWTGGAGQRLGDRPDSDASRFWTSQGINPFEPGELSLLPATTLQISDNYATPRAVVASGQLYAQTADTELTRLATVGGSGSAISFATPGTISALASDGLYWYASCADEKIYRGTTALGAAWCDLSAVASAPPSVVEWCSDRLAVVYADASSNTCLSTLSDAGAEEVAGGRFKFKDATISAVTSGDGYIWFSVNRQDRSDVYAWQIGSTDSRFVALTLPAGQSVTALGFYLGNVMIRAAEVVNGTTTRAIIYRAVSQSGALTPDRVMDIEKSGVDHSAGDFAGDDRFVFWSWRAMADDGRSGVGCLDLSTGGWTRWLYAPDAGATGVVTSLYNWNGKVGFSIGGYGSSLEGSTPLSTGYMEGSVRDLASGLTKILTDLRVTFEALPSGGSLTAAVSIDGGASFNTLGSLSAAGSRSSTWEVASEAPSGAVKLTLGASSTSPKIRTTQLRMHPLSVVDEILVLPVNCEDELRGVNGRDIASTRPSLARAKALESLVGSRVRVQDVDWPTTKTASVWEMVSAETTSVGVADRRVGRRTEAMCVSVVTLRKPRI